LRNPDDVYLYIKKGSEESGTNGANSPEQLLSDRNDKGQPCPGGEAYWLNATDGQKNSTSASTRKSQVACVYKSKDGLKDLHSSLKGPSDIRKVMYNELVNKYCDRATRLNDRISSDNSNNQCKDVAETKTQQRDWCSSGDKIKTDKTLCNKEEIGTSLYDELASKYCDANPNDPFCGCYNVVTNKCKGEDIDKEIKKLEAGREGIKGVSEVWYGFDNKTEYLNIAQIEVWSRGKNIVKDILDLQVTVGSQYNGTQYLKKELFNGDYENIYHSAGKPNDYIKIYLGKEYTIDEVKVFNRKSCGSKESNNICNDRWAGSYVKLFNSSGNEITRSERIVGDHKEGGVRVKTFFDNGVSAAKAKLTIPGCKLTIPIRRTLTDLPRKYSAALDGADKCWGNVCASKGGDTFVPENAIAAGGICSKSMTICNVDLRAGNLQDSDINIEQSCGNEEGEPPSDGSTDGTPAPMGSTSSKSSSSSKDEDKDKDKDEEELEIYEKPAFQIGTVASSLVSISSCALLIMLAM